MAKQKEKETDILDIKECPDCGSVNIKHNEERQQVICLDCGLIYEPLSPDLEQQFEITHEAHPKTKLDVAELMPAPASEKPAKPKKRKAKKPAKKAKKKAAKKKPAKKAKKKAVKKKPAKKAPKKKPAKKKPAKKPAKKKAAKKKPAKKAKKGFASRLLKKITRVKKRKGSLYL